MIGSLQSTQKERHASQRVFLFGFRALRSLHPLMIEIFGFGSFYKRDLRQLLPQTVDHVGPGAVPFCGKGQAGGKAVFRRPVDGRSGPIAPHVGLTSRAEQERQDLIVGQGILDAKVSRAHTARNAIL